MAPDLASIILHARHAAGVSQAELARRAGISGSYLSRIEGAAWERGGPWPGDAVLRALARALGLSSTELIRLRQAARSRQAAPRPAGHLARANGRLPYSVSVGPDEVDAAARGLVARNPARGTLRLIQVLHREPRPRHDPHRAPPSYLDDLGERLAADPETVLYHVRAADRPHVRLAHSTVSPAGGGDAPPRAANVRHRVISGNPLVLDLLIGDHELLLAFPDRGGHPRTRAGVVVDDPDFVAAVREWFDQSVWDARCDHVDVRAGAGRPGGTLALVFERLGDLETEYDDLVVRLSDPGVFADQRGAVKLSKRLKELEPVVAAYRQFRATEEDLDVARSMFSDAAGDDREFLRAQIAEAEATRARLEEELNVLLLPRDPNADKNVIIEIRGAEGGEEANLFAKDLFEMYARFAERRGWKVEVLGADPSDMGGFNEVTALLQGDGVWTAMKYEGGPHRVQRVPVTESQGRIHTSAATVTVLPEAEEVDVHIDPNDLKIDVYRSTGPGGQSVNTTDSAVRITHLPTGMVVAMQDEKSQIQNRAKALQVLRARLLKAEQDRQEAELSETRRGQIGGGGRSEKIRTYNYKENRVTDHRIGLTLYHLDRVLQGELDELVDALAADERTRQLKGE